MIVAFFAAAAAAVSIAWASLVEAPVNGAMAGEKQARVRELISQGRHADALREAEIWLELYPNEPTARAPIHLMMSMMALASGSVDRATELMGAARALDSSLERRVAGNQAPAERAAAAMNVISSILSELHDARQQAIAIGGSKLDTATSYSFPGEEGGAIRVVHDHSRLGDKVYFGGNACGGLLAVAGGNLTFTPSDGERLVVATRDIADIAMNAAAATEIGAFHIRTRSGAYLHLAPPAGSPDAGREIVNTLRERLGR